MAEHCFVFLIVFVLGILSGTAINALVAWLPPFLYRQWELDARHLLGQSAKKTDQSRLKGSHSEMRRALVALACGFLSVGVVSCFGLTFEGLGFIILTWSLISASLIDADHKILPDIIIIPLIWGGLLVNNFGFYTTSSAALWGGISGYMSLWIISWFFHLVTGEEGIGHGDFKLVSAIGAWGGWQILPSTVFLASSLGVFVYLSNRLVKHRIITNSRFIPFGPFIAFAGWIVILYSIKADSFPVL
ncbi:prepilin peptidase [Pseudomonas cedrina]|uniref:prepilin peptidase n=1 Tax=Pseudomonas cedrina TaxID=651740 RepID=UPI002782E4E0|nr:A24 family peptidase [Pseudomonas cedrina]MDQ0655150.1 leader peptidase (prepilin peptidase)/N-methyltransferase [Pseudomonas cedrina]